MLSETLVLKLASGGSIRFRVASVHKIQRGVVGVLTYTSDSSETCHRPGLFYAPPPFSNASRLSQQEVFKDEVAFATDKWLAANTAGHFLEDGLRSGLGFDNVIKRFAIRARKGIERRRSAASHVTSYNIQFFLVEFYATSRRAQ
jgi:hypothetical protein